MSEHTYSKNVSRRAVLKNGVLISLAGGVAGGSVGVVSGQTESDDWSAEIFYQAKQHVLPEGVTCDSQTSPDDYSLLLEDSTRIETRPVSWPAGEVGYEIRETTANSELPTIDLSPSEFQAAGDAAAETWDGHAGTIDLVKGGPDITVEFGSVDGPGSAVAVVNVSGHGNEIDTADIRLDVWHPWTVFDIGNSDCPGVHDANAYDVQGVLAHEFGHALGLGHEPSTGVEEEEEETDPLLTMYPFTTKGWTPERSPETGDIGGIHFLY